MENFRKSALLFTFGFDDNSQSVVQSNIIKVYIIDYLKYNLIENYRDLALT